MKTIILASASPRRSEILGKTGLEFQVDTSDFYEEMDARLNPHDLAKSLSYGKAHAVSSKHRNAIIIAADTIIVFQGKILGKPHTDEEARRMLMSLNGNMHTVITGFTILDSSDKKFYSGSEETSVYLKKLTLNEIESYVKSKEPMDKAGAYAIQGLGAVLVEKIEGDYFNVVGLPLSALMDNLKQFGVFILKD